MLLSQISLLAPDRPKETNIFPCPLERVCFVFLAAAIYRPICTLFSEAQVFGKSRWSAILCTLVIYFEIYFFLSNSVLLYLAKAVEGFKSNGAKNMSNRDDGEQPLRHAAHASQTLLRRPRPGPAPPPLGTKTRSVLGGEAWSLVIWSFCPSFESSGMQTGVRISLLYPCLRAILSTSCS